MLKRLLAVSLVLILSISMISCQKDETPPIAVESTVEMTAAAPGETTAVKPEPQPMPVEPTVSPSQPASVSAEQASFVMPDTSKRPFAVMIDNEGTRSLPQGGLNQAQVIYEILVEGGETRLMPVFWGTQPEMIGPVRSSRHYFLDYSMENDAIYVHFGWSPQAQKDISVLKINNINGVANGGEIFWDLTKDRGNWQDSYTSMEKILAYVKRVKYRTSTEKAPVFNFDKAFSGLQSGTEAEKVSIKYSSSVTTSYVYDAEKKIYMRYRKGKEHMERVTGDQLTAVNIIVQFHNTYTIKGDTAGRQNMETTGSGKGYYINDGKAVKIKWSKSGRSSTTKYTDEAGSAIKLEPGITWVQVVPLSGSVTFK